MFVARNKWLRISAVLGTAILAACGRDSVGPTSVTGSVMRQATLANSVLPAETIYGPATFVRATEKPRTESATFSGPAGAEATLTISSASAQGLDATVTVNGAVVFVGDADAVPAVRTFVAQAINKIEVRLTGKPGSSLTVVATAAAPASVNVAGSWTYTKSNTPTVYSVELTQIGNAITGTLRGNGPDYSWWSLEGAVTGNQFTLHYVEDLYAHEISPDYYHIGTISGDVNTIAGTLTWSSGPGGSGTFLMRR